MDEVSPTPSHSLHNRAAAGFAGFTVFLPHLFLFILIAAVLIKICRENLGVRISDIESAHIPLRPRLDDDSQRIKEIATGCTECAICLGEYGCDQNGVVRRTLKPCGHRFHKVCIDGWLEKERQCPICRGFSSFSESSVSIHGKYPAK